VLLKTEEFKYMQMLSTPYKPAPVSQNASKFSIPENLCEEVFIFILYNINSCMHMIQMQHVYMSKAKIDNRDIKIVQ
jgi:hypothetical protein